MLFLSFAAVAPLVALGMGAIQLVGQQTLQHISVVQSQAVDGYALAVDGWLSQKLALLRLHGSTFNPMQLTDEQRHGFLQLVFHQTPSARIVLLSDASGAPLSPPIYADGSVFWEREAVEADQLQAFADTIAAEPAPQNAQFGRPYFLEAERPVVPASVPVSGGEAFLHVLLDLNELQTWLALPQLDGVNIGLIDQHGELFLVDSEKHLLDPSHFAPFVGQDISTTAVTYTTNGVDVLASSTAIARTSWMVVAAAPQQLVRTSQRSVQARMLYIAAILIAVSVIWGVVFARDLVRPIRHLKRAAMDVSDGQLGKGIALDTAIEELTELGTAFEQMSQNLHQNAVEIHEQRLEIERFNQELQQRVEQRTQQLKDAQSRLVESERFAAVGELSSGLAHELNNPLAGILGMVQLLRVTDPSNPHLSTLEEQTIRCTNIVSQLQLLSNERSPAPNLVPLHFAHVAQTVLHAVHEPLSERNVVVLIESLPDVSVLADEKTLALALNVTMLNLRRLFPTTGGQIVVSALQQDRQVGLRMVLNGAQRSEDEWMAHSLQRWEARRLLNSMGGGLSFVSGHAAPIVVFHLPAMTADA